METGKTRKYLKYAIGEIILVVIGILIALQINNWNETRKAKVVEDNFFENVLLDLEKDEVKLDYYKEFHSKRIDYLDTLLTYVRNPNISMGIDKFGMYVEPLFYSANPTNYSNTFESAKSMGAFNNFKEKELIKELSQYYSDFVLIEQAFSSILRFVEAQFEPLMYTLPEGYMTEDTGNLVINEEDVQAFYKKIASIKDYRNLSIDYQTILRTPIMENYLIGDMGRTYNALGKITARQTMIKSLKERIKQYH
ncbi:hypothetical protein NA63_2859 [Flavobacteriaceae bacterium MAR_2010_105]|nr:hypothetical protein NA63_2859 [Flavobacteriaceae bacterium MAR_2010_105]